MPPLSLLPALPPELDPVLEFIATEEEAFSAFIKAKVDSTLKVEGWPLSIWLAAHLYEQALSRFPDEKTQTHIDALPTLRQVHSATRLLPSEHFPLCWMMNTSPLLASFKLSIGASGLDMMDKTARLLHSGKTRALGGVVPLLFLLAHGNTPVSRHAQSGKFWRDSAHAFAALYQWSPEAAETLRPAQSLSNRLTAVPDGFWGYIKGFTPTVQVHLWSQLSVNPTQPVSTLMQWHEEGLSHWVDRHPSQPWPIRALENATRVLREDGRFPESFLTYRDEITQAARRDHENAALHANTILAPTRSATPRL